MDLAEDVVVAGAVDGVQIFAPCGYCFNWTWRRCHRRAILRIITTAIQILVDVLRTPVRVNVARQVHPHPIPGRNAANPLVQPGRQPIHIAPQGIRPPRRWRRRADDVRARTDRRANQDIGPAILPPARYQPPVGSIVGARAVHRPGLPGLILHRQRLSRRRPIRFVAGQHRILVQLAKTANGIGVVVPGRDEGDLRVRNGLAPTILLRPIRQRLRLALQPRRQLGVAVRAGAAARRQTPWFQRRPALIARRRVVGPVLHQRLDHIGIHGRLTQDAVSVRRRHAVIGWAAMVEHVGARVGGAVQQRLPRRG